MNRFYRIFAGLTVVWAQDINYNLYAHSATTGAQTGSAGSLYSAISPYYVAIDGNLLYVSVGTSVRRINSAAYIEYSYDLGSNIYARKPIVVSSYVYVISNDSNKIYKLNKNDLTLVWQYAFGSSAGYYLVYDQNTGIMLTFDSNTSTWLITVQEYYQILA